MSREVIVACLLQNFPGVTETMYLSKHYAMQEYDGMEV
jgi:hypothetical protein